ncbi:MAG TPA: chloramphenicol acetyltransferase [Bacilli bacterium]
MKTIDIEKWPRKEHYLRFKEYAHPYYGLTCRLNLTRFRKYQKEKNLPFFISFLYLIVKAMNEIEEFRLRMLGDEVVLFEEIHPAFTVMTDSSVYANCFVRLAPFPEFLKNAEEIIEKTKKGLEPPKIDVHPLSVYYITCLPWIDFTSLSHPMTDDAKDSIPRIAWGKFLEENGETYMSFSIQVNHALVDGYPCAKAFLKIQEYLNRPEQILKL